MLGLRSLYRYIGHHAMFLLANVKERCVTSERRVWLPESDQNGHDTLITMGFYV